MHSRQYKRMRNSCLGRTALMQLLWHVPRLESRGCGMSGRVRNLARILRLRDHNVRLVTPVESARDAEQLVDGLRVVGVDVPPSRVAHWSLQSRGRVRRAARTADRLMDECDAVLTCQPEFATAARKTLRRPVGLVACCCRLLYEPAHTAENATRGAHQRWAYQLDDRLMRQAERRGFQSADAVMFDSSMTRGIAVSGYGLDPTRSHVVPPTVDVDRFRPATSLQRAELRRTLGLPEDAFVVCWTGRMADQKNVELLLDAAARSSRAIPELRLLLVGDGPLRAGLQARAANSSIGGKVRFAGMRDRVEPFLRASDVFALPSHVESFGISVIEAMACGLPAVVLGCAPGKFYCGAGESVIDGETGYVLTDDSPAAMAERWIELARDADGRRRLGEAGRRRVVDRFPLGRDAAQLEQILESVCRRN